MPRKGENIYKRKDGRWEGRILKPDGKYRYIYGKTYREIKEKKKNLQEYLKSQIGKKATCLEKASVQFEQWLNNYSFEYVKPSTYENYYFCIHKYVIPFFKNSNHDQITELQVKQFVETVCRNDTISPAYKRKILTIFKTSLRGIMKSAANYSELIELVRIPKYENPCISIFSVNEQRLVESTILHFQDKRSLGILLCFYTGIRLGELCGLKWSDLDLEAGTMNIVRTVSRTKAFHQNGLKTALLVSMPKTQSSIRKIPLPIFLIELLVPFKKNFCENRYILSGSNTPMEPRACQKLFKKILTSAGVKDRKFHAIRHTFATRALECGVDIKTLSEILGHSSVSITLNIYAHSLMEQKKIAIDKLNVLHMTQMNSRPFAVKYSVTNI